MAIGGEITAHLDLLPLELLDKIAEELCQNSLISLCGTSKRANNAAMRWLYRNVVVRTLHQAMVCCGTIASHPVPAMSLKKLSIEARGEDINECWPLVAQAIHLCRGLVTLSIPFSPALFELGLLDECSLPELKQCRLPYTGSIAPFLANHGTVENICIVPPEMVESDPIGQAPLPPLQMAHLQCFFGPAAMAVSLVPNSITEVLVLFWDTTAAATAQDIASSLAKSLFPVKSMENFVMDWDMRVLEAVATHCPSLRKLAFHNTTSTVAWRNVEEFLENVDEYISSLQSLSQLAITFLDNNFQYDFEDIDLEFRTVVRWGKLLPNLECCGLPSGTLWTRKPFNAWFPDRGGDPYLAKLKTDWLLDAFHHVKFPRAFYKGLFNSQEKLMNFANIVKTLSRSEVLDFLDVMLAQIATKELE